MNKLHAAPSLLLLLAMVAPAAAAPRKPTPIKPKPTQPAPPAPTAFAQPVAFVECQTVTAFACGMQDASGQRYGTSHDSQMCSTITFAADGSFRQTGGLGMTNSAGTYRLVHHDVELRFPADESLAVYSTTLKLNIEGTKLGNMTLVPALPAPAHIVTP